MTTTSSKGNRAIKLRFLPGWSVPPSLAEAAQPVADPAGNRAQRRRAKRLGIKPQPEPDSR